MTTFWNNADIPLLIEVVGGVDVVIGAVSVKGVVDTPEDVYDSQSEPQREHGNVVVGVTRVLVQTSAIPAARIDDAITVEGVSYSIRDRKRVGDGAMTAILLGAPLTFIDLIFGIPA